MQERLDLRPVAPGVKPKPLEAGGEPVQVGVELVKPPVPDVHHVVGTVRARDAQVKHRDLGVLDPGGNDRRSRPLRPATAAALPQLTPPDSAPDSLTGIAAFSGHDVPTPDTGSRVHRPGPCVLLDRMAPCKEGRGGTLM